MSPLPGAARRAALFLAVLASGCGESPSPTPAVAEEPEPHAVASVSAVESPPPVVRTARLPARRVGSAPVADAATRQSALAERIRERNAELEASRAALEQRAAATEENGPAATGEAPRTPAAGTEPMLEILSLGFEPVADGVGMRVGTDTNLVDGALIDALARYAGEPIPALRRRGIVRGGRLEVLLGPVRGQLSSGVYEVSLTLDPERQTATVRLALAERFGVRAPNEGLLARRTMILRQASLGPEEHRAAIAHYADVASGTRAQLAKLTEVADGMRAKRRFHVGDRIDTAELARWLKEWQAPVLDLRRKHEAFAGRFATAPHPRLVGRIDVLLRHLAQLGSLRGRELARVNEEQPVDSAEDRSTSEGFITPADLERSISQVLLELEGVLATPADERAQAQALVASLTGLASGPDYGSEGGLRPRVDRYVAWSAELDRAVAVALTPYWDPLASQAEHLRRALAASHGRALVRWLEARKLAVPADLRLPSEPSAIDGAAIAAKLELTLARLLSAAPPSPAVVGAPPAGDDRGSR